MCEARFALASIAKAGRFATNASVPAGTLFFRYSRECCPATQVDSAASFDHLNSVPSIHIRCRTTASFRATATLALRSPVRFATLKADC